MILSPDAAGQVDWSVSQILDRLPSLPVDMMPITWIPSFKFKAPETTRYVLFDFTEPHAPNDAYNAFWAWVVQNPPILTFRRELEKDAVSPTIKPVEFACRFDTPDPVERSQWVNRHIEVLFWWGYSHGSRPRLHADIWRGLAHDGISVVGSWNHLIQESRSQWASIHTPHYDRKPMEEIIPIMAQSKVTVALRGNGVKTFRHAECINTLMAMDESTLAWAYPWDDSNSIQLPEHNTYDVLRHTLESDLYERYVACCLNMKNYRVETYAREYVAKEIEKVL